MKIFKIVLSRVIGLMIFLLFLFLINNFTLDVEGYILVVDFINANAILLIVMSLLFMIAEVLFALPFPFNLPAPIFSAFIAMLLVRFILRVFGLIDVLIKQNIFSIFAPFSFIIYIIVFFAVIIGGYISIFKKLIKGPKPKRKARWDTELRKELSDFFRKLADSLDK